MRATDKTGAGNSREEINFHVTSLEWDLCAETRRRKTMKVKVPTTSSSSGDNNVDGVCRRRQSLENSAVGRLAASCLLAGDREEMSCHETLNFCSAFLKCARKKETPSQKIKCPFDGKSPK